MRRAKEAVFTLPPREAGGGLPVCLQEALSITRSLILLPSALVEPADCAWRCLREYLAVCLEAGKSRFLLGSFVASNEKLTWCVAQSCCVFVSRKKRLAPPEGIFPHP